MVYIIHFSTLICVFVVLASSLFFYCFKINLENRNRNSTPAFEFEMLKKTLEGIRFHGFDDDFLSISETKSIEFLKFCESGTMAKPEYIQQNGSATPCKISKTRYNLKIFNEYLCMSLRRQAHCIKDSKSFFNACNPMYRHLMDQSSFESALDSRISEINEIYCTHPQEINSCSNTDIFHSNLIIKLLTYPKILTQCIVYRTFQFVNISSLRENEYVLMSCLDVVSEMIVHINNSINKSQSCDLDALRFYFKDYEPSNNMISFEDRPIFYTLRLCYSLDVVEIVNNYRFNDTAKIIRSNLRYSNLNQRVVTNSRAFIEPVYEFCDIFQKNLYDFILDSTQNPGLEFFPIEGHRTEKWREIIRKFAEYLMIIDSDLDGSLVFLENHANIIMKQYNRMLFLEQKNLIGKIIKYFKNYANIDDILNSNAMNLSGIKTFEQIFCDGSRRNPALAVMKTLDLNESLIDKISSNDSIYKLAQLCRKCRRQLVQESLRIVGDQRPVHNFFESGIIEKIQAEKNCSALARTIKSYQDICNESKTVSEASLSNVDSCVRLTSKGTEIIF